jgi:hypothetical protein
MSNKQPLTKTYGGVDSCYAKRDKTSREKARRCGSWFGPPFGLKGGAPENLYDIDCVVLSRQPICRSDQRKIVNFHTG